MTEQFKRRFKGWLCAYGRKRVWLTLTEGAPYKWTIYLFTYLHVTTNCSSWYSCVGLVSRVMIVQYLLSRRQRRFRDRLSNHI